MEFHLVHIFSSVQVAQWPPFGKELFTRSTICSLCILTTVKPVLGDHCWEGPNVVSQGRWSLRPGNQNNWKYL